MLGLAKVFGGMSIFRRIAAADVTASKAFPQVDPGIAHLQTLLAALAAWFNWPDLSQVGTGWGGAGHMTTSENQLLAVVFQKPLGFEGGHAAGAGGGDRLPVAPVLHIAASVDAWHPREYVVSGYQISVLIGL